MKHIEGTILGIGVIAVKDPDRQQVMDSGVCLSAEKISMHHQQTGREDMPLAVGLHTLAVASA